ncbi:unnamed protein product [Eruca vesicaria subsp. sativa]|uniref:Uncharacterized protein n=1 Tax=Eruca vesicaria subsp. sativa TaxID=29727 RepID=A0ABC8LWS2_ERUVS|nr:unnamed protein product [Eruca vesicaria subsp. sativa]
MAEKGKEKVTMMKLKVDLDCAKCYKKVKKVLCKFPQIRDQLFDEKSNIVIIKVVCCSPERIMDKLCSKGGGSIKTIEIVQPPKPPQAQPQAQAPPQKPKDAPKAADKPKEGEKPNQSEKPKESEKPKQSEKPKESEKPKQSEKPKESDKPAAAKPAPAPAQAPAPAPAAKQPGPPPQAMPMMSHGQPVAMCYGPYYDGFGGGPAFSGYGLPPPPQQYETYGRPVYDSWGGGPPPSYRQCQPNRCDYFSEENPQSCSIM